MFVGYMFFVLFTMPQNHFYPAVRDALLIHNWQFLIYVYTPGASVVIQAWALKDTFQRVILGGDFLTEFAVFALTMKSQHVTTGNNAQGHRVL